jgi:hypothetical protein
MAFIHSVKSRSRIARLLCCVAIWTCGLSASASTVIDFELGSIPPSMEVGPGWQVDSSQAQAGTFSLRGPDPASWQSEVSFALDTASASALRFWTLAASDFAFGQEFQVWIDSSQRVDLRASDVWTESPVIPLSAGRHQIRIHYNNAGLARNRIWLDSIRIEPLPVDASIPVALDFSATGAPPGYFEGSRGLTLFDVDGDGSREVLFAGARHVDTGMGMLPIGYWSIARLEADRLRVDFTSESFAGGVRDLVAFQESDGSRHVAVATNAEVIVHPLSEGTETRRVRLPARGDRDGRGFRHIAVADIDGDGVAELLALTGASLGAECGCALAAYSIEDGSAIWERVVDRPSRSIGVGRLPGHASIVVATGAGVAYSAVDGAQLEEIPEFVAGGDEIVYDGIVGEFGPDGSLGIAFAVAVSGDTRVRVRDFASGDLWLDVAGFPVLAFDADDDGREEVVVGLENSLVTYDTATAVATSSIVADAWGTERVAGRLESGASPVVAIGDNSGVRMLSLSSGAAVAGLRREFAPEKDIDIADLDGDGPEELAYWTDGSPSRLHVLDARTLQERWSRELLPATIQVARPKWGMAIDRHSGAEPRILIGVDAGSSTSYLRTFAADGSESTPIVLPPAQGTRHSLRVPGPSRALFVDGPELRMFALDSLATIWSVPTGDGDVRDLQILDLDGDGTQEVLFLAGSPPHRWARWHDLETGSLEGSIPLLYATGIAVDRRRHTLLSHHVNYSQIQVHDFATLALQRTLLVRGSGEQLGLLDIGGRTLAILAGGAQIELLDIDRGSYVSSMEMPWWNFANSGPLATRRPGFSISTLWAASTYGVHRLDVTVGDPQRVFADSFD